MRPYLSMIRTGGTVFAFWYLALWVFFVPSGHFSLSGMFQDFAVSAVVISVAALVGASIVAGAEMTRLHKVGCALACGDSQAGLRVSLGGVPTFARRAVTASPRPVGAGAVSLTQPDEPALVPGEEACPSACHEASGDTGLHACPPNASDLARACAGFVAANAGTVVVADADAQGVRICTLEQEAAPAAFDGFLEIIDKLAADGSDVSGVKVVAGPDGRLCRLSFPLYDNQENKDDIR